MRTVKMRSQRPAHLWIAVLVFEVLRMTLAQDSTRIPSSLFKPIEPAKTGQTSEQADPEPRQTQSQPIQTRPIQTQPIQTRPIQTFPIQTRRIEPINPNFNPNANYYTSNVFTEESGPSPGSRYNFGNRIDGFDDLSNESPGRVQTITTHTFTHPSNTFYTQPHIVSPPFVHRQRITRPVHTTIINGRPVQGGPDPEFNQFIDGVLREHNFNNGFSSGPSSSGYVEHYEYDSRKGPPRHTVTYF